MLLEDKKKIVSLLTEKNYLVDPDLVLYLDNFEFRHIYKYLETLGKNDVPKVFRKEMLDSIKFNNQESFDGLQADDESDRFGVKVLFSYEKDPVKRDVQHFVNYFRSRYNKIKNILKARIELESAVSIKRLRDVEDGNKVALIGIVNEIGFTKKGNVMIHLEDLTGSVKVVINKNNKEAFESTESLVLDEVVGITGKYNGSLVFADKLIYPDVPFNKELKKGPDDVNVVFLSDLHIGSKWFLKKELDDFLDWINLKAGDEEHKELARKVKYLFIAGDLVDGVGIYPSQENELEIKDIYEQYNACYEFLKSIRKDIKIIILGGNHDALRLAEPQPRLSQEYAKNCYGLDNVTFTSNPSVVRINETKNFPGFDILLYHGYSFDYYVQNVSYLRNNGGYNRADLIMTFLLKKRHLAPTHSSTLYIPDPNDDPLVIENVPDFFVTGHIHKAKIGSYKNVTLISCSSWQPMTPFQEKVGHTPDPGKVPVINLKTREIKILNFVDGI